MPPKNAKKNIKIVPISDIVNEEPKEDIVIEEPVKKDEDVVIEDIIIEEPTKEEEKPTEEKPTEEKPTEEKPTEEINIIEPTPKPKGRKDRMAERVICPDCNKTLTRKTFEYNHKHTCKTVKAQKKADEIKAKQKEKEEEQQLKKQQEENKIREKLEKEIEEKYSKMNNQLKVEVPVVEKQAPPPPPAPKLSNMEIRRLNQINRYSKLKLQII